MPRYTAEVMYELAKSPLSGLEASNTDLNSLKVIKRRESLLYRKSFGSNQDALRRFREEAEERKPVEISIDVEDVAESDISLTEYANRYLSQKGNAGRKAKGGDAVHPKFAIALAATQAKTSKSGRGGSSNAFAAFADADENNDESAVAEDDDDDGWNTVPARTHVPTHPWHRAAARKSFGADHHRPSFNSSNKTTGVYFDARRRERPSLTRDDVNEYFEPEKFRCAQLLESGAKLSGAKLGFEKLGCESHAKSSTEKTLENRSSESQSEKTFSQNHEKKHPSVRSSARSENKPIEWAEVDTSKALPSYAIGSHARETREFEAWKKHVDPRYPEQPGVSPAVSPLSGGFATVAPLTPPGLSRQERPEDFHVPLSPPFERTRPEAVPPGVNGKPNYFGTGLPGLGSMGHELGPMGQSHVGGSMGPPIGAPMEDPPMSPSMEHASMRGPMGGSIGGPMEAPPMRSPFMEQDPSVGQAHMRSPNMGNSPSMGQATMRSPNMGHSPSMDHSPHMGPGSMPMNMPGYGPYFAVVLPPEICDQIRRGLLPPPPPPPPMHMMWRGGPLPPGVGIPVPVMPW